MRAIYHAVKIAQQIVRFVAAAQEAEAGLGSADSVSDLAVEPALLSLVCHGLNERRKVQRKDAFDHALAGHIDPRGPCVLRLCPAALEIRRESAQDSLIFYREFQSLSQNTLCRGSLPFSIRAPGPRIR
jgi:hypothetical protein